MKLVLQPKEILIPCDKQRAPGCPQNMNQRPSMRSTVQRVFKDKFTLETASFKTWRMKVVRRAEETDQMLIGKM